MQGTMFYFREALLLLLCATWGHAICSVCVTGENGTEKECSHSHHHVIQRLSDLPANCSSVHISLTSGNHSLIENLTFSDSVEDAVINSTLPSQPAIIECRNGTGISFGRMSKVNISNIVFSYYCGQNSRAALHFENTTLYTLSNVTIMNSRYGLIAEQCKEQVISNSTFINNSIGHIRLALAANATATISNTIFNNSRGAGVSTMLSGSNVQVEVSNSTFANNALALQLNSTHNAIVNVSTTISDCNFTQQRVHPGSGVITAQRMQNVILKGISLERNYGPGFNCSVLHAQNNVQLTLSNVSIADNNCTGINLLGSTMKLENTVNITGNHGYRGGALSVDNWGIKIPPLTFSKSSKLNIINNSADTYGGGIYLDDKCHYRANQCFFTLTNYSAATEVFLFSGNVATKGGDSIFGGCLSNCVIGNISINKNDPNNTFWKLVNSTQLQSLSNFLEESTKVTFCANSTNTSTLSVTCNDSYTVSVYRGETFTVPLMVTDDFCTPSAEVIETEVYGGNEQLEERDGIKNGMKYCQNISYSLKGGIDENSTTIAFSKQHQVFQPVLLTVQLKECPIGYEIKGDRCDCLGVLTYYGIKCNLSSYSLDIPAQTWLGEVSGSIGVQKCRYCHKVTTLTITDIKIDSYKLCLTNRVGILCGACAEGYSLQLGGYQCADCSNSTHIGILLLISFGIIGIALVLLLLCLNLTVSTGMINGLIFYSNIVYLNSEALLPISRESNSTHLVNTVEILYIFQAWINLDFGVTMCFFNGYTTYISTWMQFAFPLYIWLLILVIVLLSRYSSRISKLTTSNTVSVLATLLLLAYAKLLKTSAEAFSPALMDFLDSDSRTYWIPNANIPYLSQIHVPLFLMSVVIMLVYILPFTLLILLGPLLQAKSHYRLLKWINKLKPFLDAFYGPYTRRYRYWPGILLLARVPIIYNFILRSLTDSVNLWITSYVVFLLLVAWLVIGTTSTLVLHQKRYQNYIELFLLLNLGLFTVISAYVTQSETRSQQGLAVAMVGSVFALSCGILVYHIYNIRVVHKTVEKFIKKGKDILTKTMGRNNNRTSESHVEDTGSVEVTHSLLEMAECDDAGEQLREPLLISDRDL